MVFGGPVRLWDKRAVHISEEMCIGWGQRYTICRGCQWVWVRVGWVDIAVGVKTGLMTDREINPGIMPVLPLCGQIVSGYSQGY